MQTRAVIFDLFGTLVDNLKIPDYDRVMHEMARLLGGDPDSFLKAWVERYPQRAIGEPPTLREGISQISRIVGLSPDEQQVGAAEALRLEFTRETLQTRPESLDVLAKIRGRGLVTCLVSDCTWEVPMLWDDSPHARLFDGAVFSCSVGFKKPDPRMYQAALDLLGVSPGNCLYVGDGCSSELDGAVSAGIRAVQILAPHETPEFYGMHSRQQWDGPLVSHIAGVLDYLD